MPRSDKMHPFKRAEVRAREAEYQAMWQACERAARKDEYQQSSVPVRLVILREALTMLMEKRRRTGKQMCNTNLELMIERHLRREAMPRSQFRDRNLRANSNNEAFNDNNVPPAMGLAPSPLPRVEVPPMIKYDHDAHSHNHPPQYPRPLARDHSSSEGYPPPILENHSHNTTLYNELAACRTDRCVLLHRLNALEDELTRTSNLVSILFNELHPEIIPTPLTPETMGLSEHDKMMEGVDL
ncbi:hypothetical protein EDB80DRAFT_839037 [Ilyonectria destructans]|nr:hypothetical protein EDB80DRAFT_839037 [Ilyonectria destructans]